MPTPFDDAERIVRDFARRTNLQLAGRPFRVLRTDAVGAALRGLLLALGGREVGGDSTAPGLLEFGEVVTLDGATLPDRGDANGRIDFAGAHMAASRDLAADLRLEGLSIGLAMTLEPKTANLALLLGQLFPALAQLGILAGYVTGQPPRLTCQVLHFFIQVPDLLL